MSARAVVVSQGAPGVGGLGGAARDAELALSENGYDVEYVGPPADAGPLLRIARRRPLRRWPSIARTTLRRSVLRRVPGDYDLAYATPGVLPGGVAVLHQATHHPDTVIEQLADARRRSGGGRGFISEAEARVFRREIASATLIRTESEKVREDLIRRGVPAEKVFHCHPGVDLGRFRSGARPDRLRIAFVGVLSLWKGVDLLVSLAAAVSSFADIVVVGGPVCPWSRRLVAGSALQFAQDVPKLMAESHALVLPSASEGFGYVVLEAMASGCVPFVTPAVGAAELVAPIEPRLVQPADAFVEATVEHLRSLPLAELGVRFRREAGAFDRESRAREMGRRLVDGLAR